jgi:glycosyltransferase involved in cell wall biosynthesis
MNKKQFSISLIIPVYNNENTLVSQLKLAEKLISRQCKNYEIIIGEDKSSDNSRLVLEKNFKKSKTYRLIFNKNNLGIAKNIYSLYKKAKNDYIFFYSVDGDWNPYDIQKMILHLKKYNTDIVIGKRNKKNGYNLYRKLVSYFYNNLPLILFRVDPIDAGSIKIIKREIVKKFSLTSRSVFMEAELLIRAVKSGYTISSVSVLYKKPLNQSGTAGNIKLIFTSLRDLIKLKSTGI